MNYKVSIIIPVHNAENYIIDTLASCFAQTYQNIEVIVVENGSTDRSWYLVNALANQNFKCFQLKDSNASAARNYGYFQAEGKYIMFLDADDLISTDKIELQVEALSKSPADAIASCSWGKFEHLQEEASFEPQRVWTIQDPVDWCIQSWSGGGMMVPACWLIPKSIIDKAGLWNEQLTLHDDGEFICRVLMKSKANVFVPDAKVYYRQVQNSLSRQNKSYESAKSYLHAAKSYKRILSIRNDVPAKKAISRVFRSFIYEYHPKYGDLLDVAEKEIDELKILDIPEVGGLGFIRITKVIGFKRALRLRALL